MRGSRPRVHCSTHSNITAIWQETPSNTLSINQTKLQNQAMVRQSIHAAALWQYCDAVCGAESSVCPQTRHYKKNSLALCISLSALWSFSPPINPLGSNLHCARAKRVRVTENECQGRASGLCAGPGGLFGIHNACYWRSSVCLLQG